MRSASSSAWSDQSLLSIWLYGACIYPRLSIVVMLMAPVIWDTQANQYFHWSEKKKTGFSHHLVHMILLKNKGNYSLKGNDTPARSSAICPKGR